MCFSDLLDHVLVLSSVELQNAERSPNSIQLKKTKNKQTKKRVPNLFVLETSGAAETKHNCHPLHYSYHQLIQHSQHTSFHRPADRSGHIWSQDGPRLQTGLSSFLPARQELPPVFCILGQAGSDQQQLRYAQVEDERMVYFPIHSSYFVLNWQTNRSVCHKRLFSFAFPS